MCEDAEFTATLGLARYFAGLYNRSIDLQLREPTIIYNKLYLNVFRFFLLLVMNLLIFEKSKQSIAQYHGFSPPFVPGQNMFSKGFVVVCHMHSRVMYTESCKAFMLFLCCGLVFRVSFLFNSARVPPFVLPSVLCLSRFPTGVPSFLVAQATFSFSIFLLQIHWMISPAQCTKCIILPRVKNEYVQACKQCFPHGPLLD